jgi:radical SAM superfamily enzyme YgiQ (UPF0313 family)
MRIALIYPPPWKITAPGEPPDAHGDGPPADYREGDLDPDFHQIPFGLLSLGAQAIAAGHQVKVLNLSGFAWARVEEVIAGLDADLFGMSCWTSNRRGVALVAREIKKHHPKAHVVVGGPHATPLAREMLAHYPEIDTVSTGESELTFMDLVGRLERGAETTGVPGTVYRDGADAAVAPPRAAIPDLDELASPHDYFTTHIVMTSRGCPWQCTFCGAETTWGRGFRGRSVPKVLDDLEHALARVPVRILLIKDDTFTTSKKRVVELCRGISERKLNFLWSCDTRVDVLSDELLHEMRLAGCQRLSLGVESGSPAILKAINKKITVDKIIASTELAKKYGIGVRFYMMLGNRGETAETFHESLHFLEVAKPHQFLFSCLSIYPGTVDFTDAEKAGWLDREAYFTGDFQELKTPFDASKDDTRLMSDWFEKNKGLHDLYRPNVDDCRAILARLGDHHAAHMDLAGACYRAGDLDETERHVRRALELDYPLPGLALNYLACIAYRRGDVEAMMQHFLDAAKRDPQHAVLIQNVRAARQWFSERGPERGVPLALEAHHDFQLLERNMQPALPGPLDEDLQAWPPAAPRASSAAGTRDAGRLKVVPSA